MKPNRSNNYTQGLACTVQGSDKRFFLFEMDKPFIKEHFERINGTYRRHRLDYCCHRTGNGWHWISPTLIDKEEWKQIHSELKDINTKCPMTTLRIVPNKYPNESCVWYSNDSWYGSNHSRNNFALCNLLNHWFNTTFSGTELSELKIVTYPLPVTTIIGEK